MTGNGLLAGLVAITAPSGFVNTVGACILGLIAGVLVCLSVEFVEKVMKVDDPVGAISVHGTNGLMGRNLRRPVRGRQEQLRRFLERCERQRYRPVLRRCGTACRSVDRRVNAGRIRIHVSPSYSTGSSTQWWGSGSARRRSWKVWICRKWVRSAIPSSNSRRVRRERRPNMSTALQVIRTAQAPVLDRPIRPLPVPWRDPHTVSPAELKEYIGFLEKACEEQPRSADLRTCLGVAHAMNYDVYKSMDALEAAVAIWMRPTSSRK